MPVRVVLFNVNSVRCSVWLFWWCLLSCLVVTLVLMVLVVVFICYVSAPCCLCYVGTRFVCLSLLYLIVTLVHTIVCGCYASVAQCWLFC